ncbi:hypothetical protein GIB67_008736 [Kingdonia uniflora]|uniref:Pectinesterase inhibitor domain-containing protein n=1 Tax=Kingdonia uniflora TaxID=39325 RepID=A0A7J7P5I1_9MAGN|nr:hypothetical protein GIB67_008736 [Kingdonia uniflora]
MGSSAISVLVALIGVLFIFMCTPTTSTTLTTNKTNTQFIKTSCTNTTYPALCLQSLSSYSNKIKSNYQKLVYTAVSVAFKSAQSASSVVSDLTRRQNIKRSEAVALKDCVESIRDSIDELRQSLKQMKSLNGTRRYYQMSNVRTWMSAALSDDDTCLNGLEEEHVSGQTRDTIKESLVNVTQLTSNALFLCNRLNYTH